MITLEQPSMALNDERHGHMTVRMWNTWGVRRNDTRQHIIDWVATVATRAQGRKLKNVVFSCHGAPGYLEMGEGFQREHATMFSRWAGLVEKIWFRACSVALIEGSGTNSDGNLFCSEIARFGRCYVVASTETQWTRPTIGDVVWRGGHHRLPFGQLDSFEGLVLSYGPDGNVTWSQRYSSGAGLFTE